MNGWVVLGCSILLFAAAVIALIRIIIGPKTLDRMIGVDLLVTTIVGAIGLEAVYHRHATTLPVLVVLTLVGFVGSVAVARFASYEQKTVPARPAPKLATTKPATKRHPKRDPEAQK